MEYIQRNYERDAKITLVLSYSRRVANYMIPQNYIIAADDVVGDIGLWIAENLDTFSTIIHYKTFFYRFVKNLIFSKKKNFKIVTQKDIYDEIESSTKLSNTISYNNAEYLVDLKLLNNLISNPKLYGKYIKSNNKGISHLVYKDWLEGLTTEELMEKYNLSEPSISTNIAKAKSIVNQFFQEEIYRKGRIYRHGFLNRNKE